MIYDTSVIYVQICCQTYKFDIVHTFVFVLYYTFAFVLFTTDNCPSNCELLLGNFENTVQTNIVPKSKRSFKLPSFPLIMNFMRKLYDAVISIEK